MEELMQIAKNIQIQIMEKRTLMERFTRNIHWKQKKEGHFITL